MIHFKFNLNKIIQIINYLLKKNDNCLNYTKLLKLLYIADKRFLEKWDLSITNDGYSSMKQGPVLSRTYDLIKGSSDQLDQVQWNCLFFTDAYDLILLNDNNLKTNLLNKAEIQMLDYIDAEFKDYSWNDMVDYIHDKEKFPEVRWEEAEEKNTSLPLYIEDILRSLNRSDEEIDDLAEEIKAQQREAEILMS